MNDIRTAPCHRRSRRRLVAALALAPMFAAGSALAQDGGPDIIWPGVDINIGSDGSITVGTPDHDPLPDGGNGNQGRGNGNGVEVPPGHMPPAGMCRVWYPDRPPGQQPPASSCAVPVPPGAFLVYG